MVFKHASAERQETESVWVMVKRGGYTGCGEGCPRHYVTGETVASATKFVNEIKKDLLTIVTDLSSLKDWVFGKRALIDRNPAAWCAVELALLDLFAQENACSLERLLALSSLSNEYRYSAVLGDSDPVKFAAQFGKYRELGIRDFKIKLSGELKRDRAKLEAIKSEDNSTIRIRFDANNIWDCYKDAAEYLNAIDMSFFAVEEPLKVNRYDELERLAALVDTRIILDESFVRLDQLAYFSGDSETWLINLRVSKMGGLLRSLEIVKAARSRGIKLIVGAHVGETSVLTRAGLTIATVADDLLVGQEGAFGTWLLTEDVCEPSLRFGHGGLLHPNEFKTRMRPEFCL